MTPSESVCEIVVSLIHKNSPGYNTRLQHLLLKVLSSEFIQQMILVIIVTKVVVEYILSTIGVLELKRDFHSVSATMK